MEGRAGSLFRDPSFWNTEFTVPPGGGGAGRLRREPPSPTLRQDSGLRAPRELPKAAAAQERRRWFEVSSYHKASDDGKTPSLQEMREQPRDRKKLSHCPETAVAPGPPSSPRPWP